MAEHHSKEPPCANVGIDVFGLWTIVSYLTKTHHNKQKKNNQNINNNITYVIVKKHTIYYICFILESLIIFNSEELFSVPKVHFNTSLLMAMFYF